VATKLGAWSKTGGPVPPSPGPGLKPPLLMTNRLALLTNWLVRQKLNSASLVQFTYVALYAPSVVYVASSSGVATVRRQASTIALCYRDAASMTNGTFLFAAAAHFFSLGGALPCAL